jgi:hypothetical protein
VRRAALALILTSGVAAAAPGKVIRIERGHGIRRTPRVCQVQSDGRGTCWGRPPSVGEVASVIDQDAGVLGELRVSEVMPLQDDCGKTQRWDYKFTRESGRLERAQWGSSFVVFDIEVQAGRTRLVADTSKVALPDRRPGEQVWSVLDRDGDGSEDLVVTAYSCDKSGEMTTSAIAGYCIDYWNLDHGDWRKLRHDFVETCLR